MDMQQPDKVSALLEIAFADASGNKYLKTSFCIALYTVLALIWMPGITLGTDVVQAKDERTVTRRKVLKPPPERPLEKTILRDKKATKVPMPDQTPDEPEIVVEAAVEEVIDMLETDEWEIGIPDGPPEDPNMIVHESAIGLERPIFTRRAMAEYPVRGAKVRIQGYVILSAVLRKDGTVDDIRVVRGIGKGKFGFEEKAVEALSQWEFLPGKLNNKTVDVQMTLRIDFSLQ